MENINSEINLNIRKTSQETKFSIKKAIFDLETQEIDSNGIVDATPNVNHYRSLFSIDASEAITIPTIEQLQNPDTNITIKKKPDDNENKTDIKETNKSNQQDVVKFGWIKGVLIRCVLNIFGVIIFLRVSWVVGQAGVGLASLIVLVATLVTTITTLSTSAICTNGQVKGGGAYYLISRSLGPEFGGAIGIVYSFACALAAAMNVIGFAETLVSIFNDNNIKMIDGQINDTRIIGMVTNVGLLAIALIGMSWESKVQIFLLIILVLALFNFVIGSFIPGSEIKQSRGFVGYSFELFKENFVPDFRENENFAHIFGVFFPALTGILAGANISGNLKNPQKAIPNGTLLSIIITSTVYLGFCWICGFTVAREVTGAFTANQSYFRCSNQTSHCKYGLLYNYHVIEMVSEIPGLIKGNSPIIIAGIFSASLSSALASLVSAPKIFQALASDKIFPKIFYFAHGHGKHNEPWRGYFLAFFISSFFIGIGDLNVIAPIISNFFLMSYALINYSCFDASISNTPGWRPSFKYYNKWVSLAGALLCIICMFVIEWWAALVSFLSVIGLYIYVKRRKSLISINWGSSTQANIYRKTLEYSFKLNATEEHVKNFRPNFLVLTGELIDRPALLHLIAGITKSKILMVCANIKLQSNLNDLENEEETKKLIQKENEEEANKILEKENEEEANKILQKKNENPFYTEIKSSSFREGAVSLMQCVGISKLRPNTLAMGFKNDWQSDKWQNVLDYYQVIYETFQMNFGLCLLRLKAGLDCSHPLENFYPEDSDLLSTDQKYLEKNIPFNQSSNCKTKGENSGSSNLKKNEVIKLKNTKLKGLLAGLNYFNEKKHNGFVDVWWLYDDGGLTVLLPYLLMQRKHWSNCKLRIFIQTKNVSDIEHVREKAILLFSKLRIDVNAIIVFSTSDKKPDLNTKLIHDKFIENWRLKPNESFDEFPWKITEEIYKQNSEITNSHLIMHEELLKESINSELIIITINVPTKSTCAALYLSWLDILTDNLPPVLMVRGNQTPVLTYYS